MIRQRFRNFSRERNDFNIHYLWVITTASKWHYSCFLEEVTTVIGSSSKDEFIDDVDEEEEQESDDLETDAEEDDVDIQCHSSEEDSDSDDDDTVNNEDNW